MMGARKLVEKGAPPNLSSFRTEPLADSYIEERFLASLGMTPGFWLPT